MNLCFQFSTQSLRSVSLTVWCFIVLSQNYWAVPLLTSPFPHFIHSFLLVISRRHLLPFHFRFSTGKEWSTHCRSTRPDLGRIPEKTCNTPRDKPWTWGFWTFHFKFLQHWFWISSELCVVNVHLNHMYHLWSVEITIIDQPLQKPRPTSGL